MKATGVRRMSTVTGLYNYRGHVGHYQDNSGDLENYSAATPKTGSG